MSSRDTGFNPGQIAQFFKKLAQLDITPGQFARLGQASEKQFEEIDAYLSGRATITKKSFLNSVGSTILPAIKKPPVLTAGNDIYFCGTAQAVFQNVESRPLSTTRIAHGDLIERRNDFQIIEEIGDESIFEVEELSPQLARLLKRQAGGKKGVLLNDGKANIFYVRNPKNPEQVLVVSVSWIGIAQEWDVSAVPALADAWGVGRRVFRKCGNSDS